jgi:hypothetical protein
MSDSDDDDISTILKNFQVPTRGPKAVSTRGTTAVSTRGTTAVSTFNLPPPQQYVNGVVSSIRDISLPIVTQEVSKILKRPLHPMEMNGIRAKISELDITKLRGKDIVQTNRDIATGLAKDLFRQTDHTKKIDIHTHLVEALGINAESGVIRNINETKIVPKETFDSFDLGSILGKNTIYDFQLIMNPKSLNAYTSIVLDSRFRTSDFNGITKFRWTFSHNINSTDGTFNSIASVKDILEVKLLPFRIPYPSDESGYNEYRLISVYIEEFGAQSIIGHESRRYHFICSSIKNGNWIELTPLNCGRFRFDKPFSELSAMTVSFGTPNEIINFDIDRLDCTFTVGSPTTVIFTEAHNLEVGSKVYFTSFNTTTPVTDAAVIALMNRQSGHIITVTTSTEFTIAVDTTGVTPSPSSITCIFASKRIFMHMELKFRNPPR